MQSNDFNDGISVIMPTFNQASYIRRAIKSLLMQIYTQWELIIVNDESTDNTEEFIADFLSSSLPVRYIKNEKNRGLGFAINKALDVAKYDHISYLPSDDYYDIDHLSCITDTFRKSKNIVLVYSGVRYDESVSAGFNNYKTAEGVRRGYFLSLVQVAHKKTKDRWIEYNEYISEDLFL